MANQNDPELVIGLVTPVGTNTTELVDRVKGALSKYGYKAIVMKLSDQLPSEEPVLGESEDRRVLRLIEAGDAFCREHSADDEPDGDPAALARLAVREIRRNEYCSCAKTAMSVPLPT